MARPPAYTAAEMKGFPSTDWSQIRAARGFLQAGGRTAFSQLLERYLPALKWHLVRQHKLVPEDADDLLQQFVLDKLIEKRLIDHASRERGKFRTFLLSVLNNFRIDRIRRAGVSPVPADLSRVAIDEQACSFDQLWAEDMIAEAVRRTRTYLVESGMEGHWKVFHARVIFPAYDDSVAVSIDELLHLGGFDSPRQASNALANAKRVFRRELARLLGPDVDPHEEIVALLEILGRRATGGRVPRM